MATTLKVLGQAALAATTLTDVYTVPAATTAVVSTLMVCNRGAATSFRVAVAVAGAAATDKQYISYDEAIGANTSFPLTIGMTLGATDVIRCYAASANVSINVFGQENS